MSPGLVEEFDEPTMSEQDGVRYLHLGTEWIQGAMRIRRPHELVLAYTQQMMAWLLFIEPRKTDSGGILGLGAGSLLRFTLKHFSCSVETAEWNPAVTAMCRAFFRLPDNKRSYIDHVDAALWLKKPHNIGRYIALMVDLYDAEAQGPVRESLEFYQDCYRSLAEEGVMAVNLFGNHESFPRNMENIMEAFDGHVLELPEVDAGNRIVLGLKGSALGEITTAQILERAGRLETDLQLPALRWARFLLEQRHALP